MGDNGMAGKATLGDEIYPGATIHLAGLLEQPNVAILFVTDSQQPDRFRCVKPPCLANPLSEWLIVAGFARDARKARTLELRPASDQVAKPIVSSGADSPAKLLPRSEAANSLSEAFQCGADFVCRHFFAGNDLATDIPCLRHRSRGRVVEMLIGPCPGTLDMR